MARNLWHGCPGGCGCPPEKSKLIYRYAAWLPPLPGGEQGMQIDFVGVWPQLRLVQFIEDSTIYGRRAQRYDQLLRFVEQAGWRARRWVAKSDEELREFGSLIRIEHDHIAGVGQTAE